jgi:glucokinase
MILAGDVGGTKTILALYEQQDTEWFCYKKDIFPSAEFVSFSNLLEFFLNKGADVVIQSVCIGVAGPVENGDCMTTNLPWVLKRKEIASQTGAKYVRFLNDLEATAWGVLNLAEDNFIELNPDAKENPGNKAVVAAGTGLGEALIVWSDEKYHVVATEGGHADFAPRNELEIGLLRYLMEKHSRHVSYERVVCGQGLVNIYQYLKSQQYASVDSELELQMSESDPASIISENAVVGGDPLCIKALEVFCEIYGAEAGNLALKCLPKAGIILAGGIAAKILPAMQNGDFMRGYLAKGRYKSVLQDISVKVCLNSEAALLGAATVAKQNENRCT